MQLIFDGKDLVTLRRFWDAAADLLRDDCWNNFPQGEPPEETQQLLHKLDVAMLSLGKCLSVVFPLPSEWDVTISREEIKEAASA